MRLVAGAMCLLSMLPSGAVAKPVADESTEELAREWEIDPVDLQGAANTSGVDAREYLIGIGVLERPGHTASSRPSGRLARVRLTYYNFGGVTAGCRYHTYAACQDDYLGHPYIGSTACSLNFPIGTRFVLPEGSVVLCNDRGGGLGNSGWLDIWRQGWIVDRFGPYATVEVIP